MDGRLRTRLFGCTSCLKNSIWAGVSGGTCGTSGMVSGGAGPVQRPELAGPSAALFTKTMQGHTFIVILGQLANVAWTRVATPS